MKKEELNPLCRVDKKLFKIKHIKSVLKLFNIIKIKINDLKGLLEVSFREILNLISMLVLEKLETRRIYTKEV